jgi:serine/threonine protein kinase
LVHRAILFKPIEFPSVEENDPNVNDVLRLCLEKDPLKRPSVEELLEHPYLRKNQLSFAENKD